MALKSKAFSASTIIPILAVVVLAADQLSKWWAISSLTEGERVQVLGDFLIVQLAFNPGGAFSMGSGLTWLFTLALAAVAGFIIYLAFKKITSKLWAVALGLLLGGVLGNLADRLFRAPGFPVGHVVDFIYTPWMMPAIYNVADIFIVTMIIAIAIFIILGVRTQTMNHSHKSNDDSILGAAGDEFPPEGGVAGFQADEFPVANPDAGIPVDEMGLPPLSEKEQREAQRQNRI